MKKNRILNSPELHEDLKKETVWIFLGGPCQGSEDWQSQFASEFSDLGVTICNPRRENMGDGPEYYAEQLEWERTHLEASDILAFWFPQKAFDVPGRDYGQTTRYELGEWISKVKDSGKTMILGVDHSIPGRRYFLEKTLDCPWIYIVDSWDKFKSSVDLEVRARLESDKTWFTSDTHFGSFRILTLSKRPFIDTTEMDWAMIRNWNARVAPKDHVWHLGDFGNPEVLRWLNGNITMIYGNYEEDDLSLVEKIKSHNVVCLEGPIILKCKGMIFGLSHRPSQGRQEGTDISLFGHTHGHQMVKVWPGLDVGVDAHHFRPIGFDDICFWYNGIVFQYDSENWL